MFKTIKKQVFLVSDDCIIFYKTTKVAVRSVKYILDHYCEVSGQLVNLHKSEIYFSKGVSNIGKRDIERISR